jgi:hypothetical protein
MAPSTIEIVARPLVPAPAAPAPAPVVDAGVPGGGDPAVVVVAVTQQRNPVSSRVVPSTSRMTG